MTRNIIYDGYFIRCVTLHPPDGVVTFSSADPSAGFQLVSPVGNMFGDYIEYNKHDVLKKTPGSKVYSIFWQSY